MELEFNPLDPEWLFDPPAKPAEGPQGGDDFEEFGDQSTEIPSRERGPGALAPTWWLLGDEAQDLSDVYERAGGSLDKCFDYYKIFPIRIDNQRKLFGARYEFPQHNRDFIYSEAVTGGPSVIGLIDFLTGFPMSSTEMLVLIGQYSSREEQVEFYQEEGSPIPPIPNTFFEGYEQEKRLLNLLYIDEEGVETLADGLPGEPPEEGLHWWCRINVKDNKKFPIPGEFLALANRPWCTLAWGEQESSPYFFSGEWMDTVYYTGAVVKEVINDPAKHYPTYKVQWRKNLFTVKPTDFAEYQVGDYVTILKEVSSKKNSQLWKDKDTKDFNQEWVIAPIIFYGFKGQKVE